MLNQEIYHQQDEFDLLNQHLYFDVIDVVVLFVFVHLIRTWQGKINEIKIFFLPVICRFFVSTNGGDGAWLRSAICSTFGDFGLGWSSRDDEISLSLKWIDGTGICLVQCVAVRSSSLGVVAACDDDNGFLSGRFDIGICCLFNVSERRCFSCWNEELTGGNFEVETGSYSESVVDARWIK